MNKGDLRPHVGGAEEGDRRPLHHRMGRQVRRAVGRLRARRHRQDQGRCRATRSIRSRRRSSPSGEVRRAAASTPGPTTSRRPAAIRTRSMKELQGIADEVQRGVLIASTRPYAADDGGERSRRRRRFDVRTCTCRRACGRPDDEARWRERRAAQSDGSLHRLHRADRGDLRRHRRGRHLHARSCCAISSASTIPDSYDFGQLLLGILIFWGIAATSYRGTHITVDLVWANVSPRWQRVIDVFATLVLLFVVTVQTYTLFDKVVVDLRLPTC